MKNILNLFLWTFLFSSLAILSSCVEDEMDESLPVNPVLNPIKSVTAQDAQNTVTATINNNARTIHLNLTKSKPSDLKAVKVKLNVSKRARLVSPSDTIITVDLSKPYPIVINNLYKDVTYTLTASIPETFLIEKSKFQEFRLNNDSPRGEGNITFLWNNEIMTKPEDYGSIGYRNYLTGECFTFDMGEHYYLYRFRANLYWAYTNVCPKRYQLLGYLKDGEPPISGNWADWTVLGTIDNSGSVLANFALGDNLEFSKENSKRVRYLRVRCLENYRNPPTTQISLCEVTLWAHNL